MLEACVVRGVRERLPEDGVTYQAAADPSGGRRDAFTVALGHQVGDRIVVDVVRDWAAPFNPSGVVAEAADLCRRYRVHALVGDNFGAEWIVEPFRQHGITYRGAALDRSRLYLELLPIVNTLAGPRTASPRTPGPRTTPGRVGSRSHRALAARARRPRRVGRGTRGGLPRTRPTGF